jgi:hypothetical protein
MTQTEQEKIILEIGYISIAFSNFDFCINKLNILLINISNDKIGEIISGEAHTDRRMQLCKQLLKVIPLENNLIKGVLDNLKSFENLKIKRNKFIHGIWHTISEEDVVNDELFLTSIKDWGKIQSEKIELTELQQIKTSLQDIATKQEKLNEEIYKNYHSLIEENEKQEKLFSEHLRNGNITNERQNG